MRICAAVLLCALGCGDDAGMGVPGDGGADAPHGMPDAPADAARGGAIDGSVDAAPLEPLACLMAKLNALVQSATPDPMNVPANCAGNPPLCCPGGTPQNPCGPLLFDYSMHAGDDPRLVTAMQSSNQVNVTLRARVRSMSPLPIAVFGTDCLLTIDTTPGPTQDIEIDFSAFEQTGPNGPTLSIGGVNITRLTSDDASIGGTSFTCTSANFGLSFYLATLTSTFAADFQSEICSNCPCN